jgi:hypothetical protein
MMDTPGRDGIKRISMWRVIFGIFIVLHGLVHLLYAGHSQRLFKLVPGMTWPDESWAFSGMPGENGIRAVATALLALAALGLLAGGIGIAAQQRWARSLVVGAAVFSSLVFVLLWNGKSQSLDSQGGVGLLLNVLILIVLLILRWPLG